MNELLLSILSIIGLIIGISVLCNMPNDFLKEFEKSCCDYIKKKDKEN